MTNDGRGSWLSALSSWLELRILPANSQEPRADGCLVCEARVSACKKCQRPGCRRSRPLCRWKRLEKPNQRACGCGGGYHYPHRIGSPLCEHNPDHAVRMWEELDKPRRKAG